MSKLKDKQNQDMLDGFIHEYLPLVQRHITTLTKQGLVTPEIDEGDLHLAGIRGLMEAAHRYDPQLASTQANVKNPFAVYASQRIRGKMLDHIHGKYNEHVPKHKRIQDKNLAARFKEPEAAKPTPSVAPEAPAVTSAVEQPAAPESASRPVVPKT